MTEKIIIDHDMLEDMDKMLESGELIRVGMFVQRNRDFQPERSKREEDKDHIMKNIAPICDTIIELRPCGTLNTRETK